MRVIQTAFVMIAATLLPTAAFPKGNRHPMTHICISCGRRMARSSKEDFGAALVCATWGLRTRATIFRTAVIITC